MKNISVFDFDGTLTAHDSLLAFIIHVRGSKALFLGLLRFSVLLVPMLLRVIDNGRVKERVFRHFFGGMTADAFNAACDDFGATHQHLWRPAALAHVKGLLADGGQVVVVTASIDRWVAGMFVHAGIKTCVEGAADSGGVMVLGTRADEENGIITGRFASPNCYGAEKVNRLRAVVPDRSSIYINAYGDSRGDKEMFNYADKSFYKPFR